MESHANEELARLRDYQPPRGYCGLHGLFQGKTCPDCRAANQQALQGTLLGYVLVVQPVQRRKRKSGPVHPRNPFLSFPPIQGQHLWEGERQGYVEKVTARGFTFVRLTDDTWLELEKDRIVLDPA